VRQKNIFHDFWDTPCIYIYYPKFVGTFMEIQNQQSAKQSINQGSNYEPNYVHMVYSKSCRTSLIL
jgi:hypothetical protein